MLLLLLLPSLCDSTLLKVQSPNPCVILSKNSPEKLLLPHPTDLDLDTLLSLCVAVTTSSSTITPTLLPPPFTLTVVVVSVSDKVFSACFVRKLPTFLLLWRCKKDQNPFRFLGVRSEPPYATAAVVEWLLLKTMFAIFFFLFASKNGSLLLLSVTLLAEREREAVVVVMVELRTESDLKEGEEVEEEEERCLGRGKEEEVTSFPSFSWRQRGQIPPGFFVKG
ncbi:hypothetical protein HID58_007430, partial [Brassica napus]